jgi:hypothetical protein
LNKLAAWVARVFMSVAEAARLCILCGFGLLGASGSS